jgi:hypothetical protein
MTRSLPVRVHPLSAEALDSWLAASAQRMQCTWGEILDAVLPESPDTESVNHNIGMLWGALTEGERASVSDATEVAPDRLDAMTLAGRFGDQIISIDPSTRNVSTPWGRVHRQRFCPACLRATNGRFNLEWRLPWVCACTEHRCLLVDVCPVCARAQDVAPRWFLKRRAPLPDRCRNAITTGTTQGRCPAVLATASIRRLYSDDPILVTQQTLRDLVACDVVAQGVYATIPVVPEQLLKDVRGLANRIFRTSTLDLILDLFAKGTSRKIERWHHRLGAEIPGEPRDRYSVTIASSSSVVALSITAALTVLLQASIEQAGETLRTLTRRNAQQLHYGTGELGQFSEAVVAVEIVSQAKTFSVFDEFRYRTASAIPRLPDIAREKSLLSEVPTLRWPRCAARLHTGNLPWKAVREVLARLLVTIGSVAASPDLEQRLLSRLDQHRASLAARRMRAHPNWSGISLALLRLHDYLSHNPPPIDYQRRREMAYDGILSERYWNRLVEQHNVPRIPVDAVRGWLIERVSGVPATMVNDRTGARQEQCEHEEDEIRVALNTDVTASLDSTAIDFLAAHGVKDEPLQWEPPSTLFDGLGLPEVSFADVTSDVVTCLLDQGASVPGIAYKLKVPVWKVRYQLEQHPRPAPNPTSVSNSRAQRKRPAHSITRTLEEALPQARSKVDRPSGPASADDVDTVGERNGRTCESDGRHRGRRSRIG